MPGFYLEKNNPASELSTGERAGYPQTKAENAIMGSREMENGKRDPDTDTWKTNLCGRTAKANTNRGTNTGVEVESTITMFPPQAYALVSGIFSGVAAHKRCILTQTNQTNS